MVTALGAYMVILSPLVKSIYELSADLKQKSVTFSGEENLFSCSDLDKDEIVRFIEHKNELVNMLDDTFNGIQIKFGQENDDFIIGNSSMIVSKYKKGSKTAGSLGIIGPMRIDYAKIIPYVEYFTEKLTLLMSDDVPDDESNK